MKCTDNTILKNVQVFLGVVVAAMLVFVTSYSPWETW